MWGALQDSKLGFAFECESFELNLCCIAVVSDGPDMVEQWCVFQWDAQSPAAGFLSAWAWTIGTPHYAASIPHVKSSNTLQTCADTGQSVHFFFFNPVTRYGVVMVYWNHHVLSVFVQALPRRYFLKCPTFCNHSWYCGATLHGVECQAEKMGCYFQGHGHGEDFINIIKEWLFLLYLTTNLMWW